jgi:hypothetical protein
MLGRSGTVFGANPGPLRANTALQRTNHVDKTRTKAFNEEQAEKLRLLPLVSSTLGVIGVIGNRLVDGATPTLVASSAQSRADVATILMAAVLGLTGLQWLSLKPKSPKLVELDGDRVDYINADEKVKGEIRAIWDAVGASTKTDMMVLFWKEECVCHLGYKRKGLSGTASLVGGGLCDESRESNISRSLANLVLFPGRFEFLEYLPSNTQSIYVQPLHPHGVLIVGSATQRSYTVLDQAWISTWCDKLFVALEDE